jgi:hypothetical protein
VEWLGKDVGAYTPEVPPVEIDYDLLAQKVADLVSGRDAQAIAKAVLDEDHRRTAE